MLKKSTDFFSLTRSKCWRYQRDAGRVIDSLPRPAVCWSDLDKCSMNLGKFLKSSGLPLRSGASGYSQSRSTPSMSYLFKKAISDLMNFSWFSSDRAKSEKTVAVGPGSLNVQPPMAM
jgi:hypothetical protein